MKDNNKTREHLLKELAELEKRVIEIEKTNKDLLDNVEKYRNIIENADLGIISYNETGQCMATNRAMAEIVGTTVEELLSQNFNEIESWKKSGLLDTAKEVLASDKKKKKSFHISTTFGKDIWLDVMLATYIEKGGKFLLFLGEDITKRKRSEKALQESERKYKDLNDASIDGHAWTDMEGHLIEINESYENMMGYSKDELRKLSYKDITPEKWHASEQKILIEQILARGYSDPYEKELIRKDGTIFPVALRAYLIKDAQGNNQGMRAVVRDITNRKEAENKLKMRAAELKETNIALKVLLKQRENDKSELEEKILSNIKHIIMPYIEKLKTNRSMSEDLAYLNILESNIKEIVSPFSSKLSYKYLDFTPKEIMIANLIIDGKQDKDITELLNIAIDTVKFHRKNIRKKLGIYGKRTNLRSHLLSALE